MVHCVYNTYMQSNNVKLVRSATHSFVSKLRTFCICRLLRVLVTVPAPHSDCDSIALLWYCILLSIYRTNTTALTTRSI